MGSYARFNFENGNLNNWYIQDIYIPDGQLKGHVNPIEPIQQAFRQGNWKLRNANWDIDFRQSATDIKWFFEKGGEKDVSGIIAINLGLMNKIIDIFGPLEIENDTVTSENFYDLAQKGSEYGFFPGSHQKKLFLSSVGGVLWNKIITSSTIEKAKVAKTIANELNQNQILVWHEDPTISKVLAAQDWDGSLIDYEFDYFYLVESNLGANKTNSFIERQIEYNISENSEYFENELILNLKNTYPYDTAIPPYLWGGHYINYQRVVLPLNAEVVEVKVGDKILTKKEERDILNLPEIKEDFEYQANSHENHKEIGFWIVVEANTQNSAQLTYKLPNQNKNNSLTIQKQPGIDFLPVKIYKNEDLVFDKNITKNTTLTI